MKKLLLALPILTLPLTAMAQDKPATMPQSIIDAAKKRFKPAFCSDDVASMAKTLNDCYMKVAFDPTETQYQECLLGDLSLIPILDTNRKIAIREGKPDPYPNLPSFLERTSMRERLRKMIITLKSRGYNTQEQKDYLNQPSKEFDDYIFKSCNK